MKKNCGDSCGTNEKENYRLHYCGTCKSIGSIYGQGARLFLNFDVVFLSELLSALSSEKINEWQDGFQSHNCFAKIEQQDIPLALKYTSAVNVFLSELKIQDHIQDEKNILWKGVKLTYSKSFKNASNDLSEFGLSIEEIQQIFNDQTKLEKEKNSIEKYAEPTAKITALIFRKGGELINKNEKLLEDLGFNFGQLAYVLDAYEDYGKDEKKNSFNGIKYAYDLKGNKLNDDVKNKIEEMIFSIQEKIISSINHLKLEESIKKVFVSRLTLNVHRKLFSQEEEERKDSSSWKESKQKTKAIIKNIKNPVQRKVQYASLSLVVYIHPETINTLKEVDYNNLSVVATLATLFSAVACFAGKKKKKWTRRLNRFFGKKRCIECDICSSCCDFSSCCDYCCTESCNSCCDTCQDDCDAECNKFLKILLWTLLAIVLIGIILTVVLVA